MFNILYDNYSLLLHIILTQPTEPTTHTGDKLVAGSDKDSYQTNTPAPQSNMTTAFLILTSLSLIIIFSIIFIFNTNCSCKNL